MDDHHRFLLTSLLTHIDFLEEQISDCNRKIEQVLSELSDEKAELVSSDDQLQNQALVSSTPVGTESLLAQERVPEDGPKVPLSYQQAITLLESIPGINQRIAEIFLAEVGTDMQRFPTAGHLASWVGICPGNHQSAGKQLRGTTRHPVIAGCVKPSLRRRKRAMRTKDT